MNRDLKFSDQDLNQIKNKGIEPSNVSGQLTRFKNGFPSLKITSPATIGKGIVKLSSETLAHSIQNYEKSNVQVLKFVPASGAATRMFKTLYAFLDQFDGSRETLENISREEKKIGKFFTELDEFAFYRELEALLSEKEGFGLNEAMKQNKHNLIVEMLLGGEGMNYGNLPKGLLSFHEYEDHVRTPAQEHLAEGLAYAEKNGAVKLHFTVSPEHLEAFEKHISDSIANELTEANISASFSVQQSHTDTIASTVDFEPFRDEAGILLFRPAGHGALLDNLNDLSADIIFIKNIDNVVPDHLRGETNKYKKALAGILLDYQQRAFDLLKDCAAGKDVEVSGKTLLEEMGVRGDFSKEEIVQLLDRPIRVCGMVKNEGEPGGGPFWVKGEKSESLQIVESAQVNKSDKQQHTIFKNGTHFNPVDIVCGVKNYKGEKFDLLKFRDEEAGFIAEKTYNGQKLLAMELPGLWNGSMANWNTIFVEVPLVTFNPVKTVTDLLKPAHR